MSRLESSYSFRETFEGVGGEDGKGKDICTKDFAFQVKELGIVM